MYAHSKSAASGSGGALLELGFFRFEQVPAASSTDSRYLAFRIELAEIPALDDDPADPRKPVVEAPFAENLSSPGWRTGEHRLSRHEPDAIPIREGRGHKILVAFAAEPELLATACDEVLQLFLRDGDSDRGVRKKAVTTFPAIVANALRPGTYADLVRPEADCLIAIDDGLPPLRWLDLSSLLMTERPVVARPLHNPDPEEEPSWRSRC